MLARPKQLVSNDNNIKSDTSAHFERKFDCGSGSGCYAAEIDVRSPPDRSS